MRVLESVLKEAQKAGHRVTFTGDRRSGYLWECSCGVHGSGTYLYEDVRTEDAHYHQLQGLIEGKKND